MSEENDISIGAAYKPKYTVEIELKVQPPLGIFKIYKIEIKIKKYFAIKINIKFFSLFY